METITDQQAVADADLSPNATRAALETRDAMLRAEESPLDRAVQKPLGRTPTAMAPSLWDVQEPITIVPQPLRPEQVTTLEHYAELEGYAVEHVVSALTVLAKAAQQVMDARDALRADPIRHERELILDVHDLHARLSPAALKVAQQSTERLQSAIASHEAKLNESIKDNAHGAEVRAYVRSLPKLERLTVLTQAVNNGDAMTVGALLNSTAPSMLSGLDLTADMRAAMIRQWNTKRDPKAAKQLALMRAALGKLEAAGSVFIGATDGLVGAKDATVRRARAARERYRTVIGINVGA